MTFISAKACAAAVGGAPVLRFFGADEVDAFSGCPCRARRRSREGAERGCGGGGGARGTHRRRLELYQDGLERPIDEAWREGPRAPAHVAVCQGPGRRGRGLKRVRSAAARPGSGWRAMGGPCPKRPFGSERRATPDDSQPPGTPSHACGRSCGALASKSQEGSGAPGRLPGGTGLSIHRAVTARVGLFSTSPWLGCFAAAAPAAVCCSSCFLWQHSSTRIGMAHPRDVEGEQRYGGRRRRRRAASAAPPRAPASSNH